MDWIGTSMGGLVGMALAARPNTPLRRLVLNDGRAFIPWTGLVRIKGYTGKMTGSPRSREAEPYLRGPARPLAPPTGSGAILAEHGVRKLEEGVYCFIRPGDRAGAAAGRHLDIPLGARLMEGVDLWAPGCREGADLVLRGAESDVLTARVVAEMSRRGPRACLVEIPGVGHARR